ncbi:MAG: FAD-dependent oxidoreductase [archaeon]
MGEIAIVGGGLSGLAIGHLLSPKHRVVIYEKSPELGGALQPVRRSHYEIEGFYHHAFRDDRHFLKLCADLGIPVSFRKAKTALLDDGLYPMSGALNILGYSRLGIADRARLTCFLAKILAVKNLGQYDRVTARDWVMNNGGSGIYRMFFGPMLDGKWGADANDVSAAWLIGRFQMRSRRSVSGETLGYPAGGFVTLIRALEKKITQNSGRIHSSSPVSRINIRDNRVVSIDVKGKRIKADAVICTIPNMLDIAGWPAEYRARIARLRHQRSVCLVLGLKRGLSEYYWTNVMQDLPYRAIIEHTNFQQPSLYREHIVYLASYPSGNTGSCEEICRSYVRALRKQFSLADKDINWVRVVKTEHAGLVYRTGVLDDILDPVSPVRGLFVSGMNCAYPQRSMDKILSIANRVAQQVGDV